MWQFVFNGSIEVQYLPVQKKVKICPWQRIHNTLEAAHPGKHLLCTHQREGLNRYPGLGRIYQIFHSQPDIFNAPVPLKKGVTDADQLSEILKKNMYFLCPEDTKPSDDRFWGWKLNLWLLKQILRLDPSKNLYVLSCYNGFLFHKLTNQRDEGTTKAVIKCHFHGCFDNCLYAKNTPDQV